MGYLGGDRQSMAEKQDRVRARLQTRPGIYLGWPWQCRCGMTTWIKYRGRFYCWHCGKRNDHPDTALPGHKVTLRQAMAVATKTIEKGE